MDDLRLALRAFRWRRGGSIVVLVAAALTVAAAALGPLYAAAAAESVLQDRLTQSQAVRTTIAFRVQSDVSYPASVDLVSSDQAVRGTVPGYGPAVRETVVATSGIPSKGLEGLTQAVWRDGVCDHLVIVQGTCSFGVDQAVVSERTAASIGWVPGVRLTLSALQQFDPTIGGDQAGSVPVVVTVVGTYRPSSTQDPYWAGRVYFPFHPNPNPDGPDTVDAVFVAQDLFPTLVHPTPGTIGADLVLSSPQDIRVADVPTVRAAVTSYLGTEADGPRPETDMIAVLDEFEAERTSTAVAAGVVTAQLALLAWLLLYLVVTDTSEARGGEVALAKLRGLPPRAVAAVALREPVVLLALAAPLGLVLAYVAVVLLARATLAAGVPIAVTWLTVAAVVAAFVGGLVAALLASRRMFTRPVLEQWAQTGETAKPSRTGLVADVVLAVVALGGFLALSRPGASSNALGWLAPGLLVVAAALLLVRVARPLLGRLVAATRASRRLGLFLGSRQALRRPAGLRLAALLAVTLGLATFAVDASAAAATGREVRAGLDVGAVRSVAVQTNPAVDLTDAVHSVDPAGDWAMVVADWIPSGGIKGRLLAIESDRLAGVGAWATEYGDLSADDVARLLTPRLPDRVVLATTRVRVTLTSGPVPDPAPAVRIGFRASADVPSFAVSTPLREGTHDYEAEVPCASQDCVLSGLLLDRAQSAGAADLDVTLRAVARQDGGAWQTLATGLDQPGTWRVAAYTGTATGELTPGPDGLRYTATVPQFTSPFLQYADVPTPLPIVTVPAIMPVGTTLTMVDGNGRDVPVTSVGESVVLPVVGDFGSVVDLTSLRRVAQELDDDADWSVWLGADAPPDALQRLEKAGVFADVVRSQQERRDELSREGPALALRLLLVCAIVGSVLAAGALAISVAVTGRRRSYELAALRAVGVPRRTLLTACVLEQALLLGTGLVVGVPVGLVVARLALPLLPQSTSPTSLPITLDVQTLAVGTFAVVTALLLLVTAYVGGTALLRQAVPDRLREVAA